jgi:hypothetical protein
VVLGCFNPDETGAGWSIRSCLIETSYRMQLPSMKDKT